MAKKEMSENMASIMAKVRAHIMTGKSASTPPFSNKATSKPKGEVQKEEVAPPATSKTIKAKSIKWPTDDDIPY